MRLVAHGEKIESPSWPDVERAIDALDGDANTFLAVERGDEHVGVGGGARGLCVVYWEQPGESSNTALRPIGDWSADDEVTMVVAGQQSEVPMSRLVDRACVREIVREYFERGTLSTIVNWHKEN